MAFSTLAKNFQVCSRSHAIIFTRASRKASTNVGFIGLGNMGGFMAKNLMNKGHKLVVYDVSKAATEALAKAGATVAKNPADVAAQSGTVVTMLPNNDIVTNVYTGKDGVFEGLQSGSILLDSSTVDPSVPTALEKIANSKGSFFLDTPVSGGVIAAQSGELTFMVGGDKQIFEKAQGVLSGMGKKLVHCGGIGMGQAAKICNNMLLGISMAGVAEAMNLGIRLGLDGKQLMDIINNSTGRCWSSEIYNPVPGLMPNVPSARDYEGGFYSGLIAKDLGLAQGLATRTGSPIPMGALASQIYRLMCKAGLEVRDFSSVYKFIQDGQKI
ncbi:Hypothetical predicted protein [Cloeon dipterum]|uniref:3-hydroxyisobutyrate dehydrogenase n=2 Tax=Cloeon dipterum TaxID=197152 RepID=A0A8S1CXW1_9INSE|nr:Hypothetical predicted protein [Cloeon dipterum]